VKRRFLIASAFLLCLITPLWAQGGPLSLKPGVAYRFTSPKDAAVDIQTSVVVDVPLHYLVPLTEDGAWNLQVIGGAGAGTDFTNSMFGLGAAYAPRAVPNVILGAACVVDISWPDADFTRRIYGLAAEDAVPDETWITIGAECSLDFIVPPGLPGSLIAGAGYGLRGKPNTFYVAFQVPVSPEIPEERVHRVADAD
jgi:hypothetical protein